MRRIGGSAVSSLSALHDDHPKSPDASIELRQVIAEVVDALHGSFASLTAHPDDGSSYAMYVGHHSDAERIVAQLLRSSELDDLHRNGPDNFTWLTDDIGAAALHAIALPIGHVPGHSKLIITVFFEGLTEQRRAAAEAAYLRRRPFAVGFFRLFQQERLLKRENAALRSALDRVGVAMLLITRSAEIAFANTAARALLEAGTGLRQRAGQLYASNRDDSVVLNASVAHILAASDVSGSVEDVPLFTIRRDGGSPLIVATLPAPLAAVEAGDVGAVIVVVDPDLEITDLASAVCRVFGLTRTESELACKLAVGRTIQQAALELRIKDQTARSYLRSVFMKTGTNRQADLVRTILVSLVRIAPITR